MNWLIGKFKWKGHYYPNKRKEKKNEKLWKCMSSRVEMVWSLIQSEGNSKYKLERVGGLRNRKVIIPKNQSECGSALDRPEG